MCERGGERGETRARARRPRLRARHVSWERHVCGALQRAYCADSSATTRAPGRALCPRAGGAVGAGGANVERGGGGRGRSARHFFLAPSCAQGALMQRARALSARTVERLARLPVRDAVHGAPPLLPPTSAPPTRRETPSRGGRAWRGGAGRNLRSDGAARGHGAGARDGRGDGCSPGNSGRLAARCVAPPPPALARPPPPPASARSRREFARFQTSAPDGKCTPCQNAFNRAHIDATSNMRCNVPTGDFESHRAARGRFQAF